MSKLTDIIHDLFKLSSGRYSVVSQYTSYDEPLTIRCHIHNCTFDVDKAHMLYKFDKISSDVILNCPECQHLKAVSNKVKVTCEYCGKVLYRYRSWDKQNKTSFAFCCVEHKNLMQRIGSSRPGLLPDHYGKSKDYRKLAFASYEHCCAVCRYSECEDILEVHHIDEDRTNNSIDNLVILCPNCHKKLSLKLYKLVKTDRIYSLVKLDPEDVVSLRVEQSKYRLHTSKTRPVVCLSDNLMFSSLTEASKHYEISDSAIIYALDHNGYCKLLNKTFAEVAQLVEH